MSHDFRMESLKSLANKKVKESRDESETLGWDNFRERLNDFQDEIQNQRLIIIELEEANGVITQENAWLQEEVDKLKVQVVELEEMIYSESIR